MKKLILKLSTLFLFMSAPLQSQDWPNFERYKAENEKIGIPSENENRVVFMGNSITQGWKDYGNPELFSDSTSYINRGIGGQTTPQMLVRFRADVIALKPKAVVILAGINDIAENTGPTTLEMIQNNIVSMVELAKANQIKVIISSILPLAICQSSFNHNSHILSMFLSSGKTTKCLKLPSYYDTPGD